MWMKADKLVPFWVCGWNPKVCPFKWKLLNITFLWYCLLCSESGGNFWVCGWNPMMWAFGWKLLEQCFSVVLFIMLYIKVVVTFDSVDEILWCEHSDESYTEYSVALIIHELGLGDKGNWESTGLKDIKSGYYFDCNIANHLYPVAWLSHILSFFFQPLCLNSWSMPILWHYMTSFIPRIHSCLSLSLWWVNNVKECPISARVDWVYSVKPLLTTQ